MEREYQRQLNLLKEEATTEQRVESAKTAFESAQSNYQEIIEKIHSTELMASEANSVIPFGNTIIQQKKQVSG
jgi:multidrug resistance efflux pump